MKKWNTNLKSIINAIIVVISLICFISCSSKADKGSGKIVASVDDSHLFEDDILKMGLALDSGLVTQNFIAKWAKNELVLVHAKQLSEDNFEVDVEELVNKYRDNLLRAYYEKYLVQTQLDTHVIDEDIKAYYDDHKSEFTLDHKILKCRLVKVKKKYDKKKLITKWIKSKTSSDRDDLLDYCNEKADFCLTSFDKWHDWQNVKSNFPKGIHLNKRDIGKSVRTETKNYVYYLYLIDYLSYKDNAPFGYIKSQAKKAIIFDRRVQVMQLKREELYNNALKENRIKIFLGN